MRWVRDAADCPSNLASVLYTAASYMDKNGRGCWASIESLAAGAKKGHRQIEKDMAELRKRGQLVLGDQSLVAHLLPGQRPIVYDLSPDAVEWIKRHSIRHRTPVTHDGGNSRRTGRGYPRHGGSQTPVTHDGQDPPTGGDRAGRAQGSAPRAGANTNPCAAHAFVDDGHGHCALDGCGLPKTNTRRHARGAPDADHDSNPRTVHADLHRSQGAGADPSTGQPRPEGSDLDEARPGAEGARPESQDRADPADSAPQDGGTAVQVINGPGGRVFSVPTRTATPA